MTFVNAWNGRFKTRMWSDSRLVNAAPNFCLCANCVKGMVCPTHDEFMAITERLKVAGPIFACPEFVEKVSYNYLNQYFEEHPLSESCQQDANFYERQANKEKIVRK